MAKKTRTKVLQVKSEDEAELVLERLKSKSLKSFFVSQAIIHFSQADKGEMFLKEDTNRAVVKKKSESVVIPESSEEVIEVVKQESEINNKDLKSIDTKMPEW